MKNIDFEKLVRIGSLVDLNEREIKMLVMSLEYADDPFGAPNHLLMVLVAKLWTLLEKFSNDEGLKQ